MKSTVENRTDRFISLDLHRKKERKEVSLGWVREINERSDRFQLNPSPCSVVISFAYPLICRLDWIWKNVSRMIYWVNKLICKSFSTLKITMITMNPDLQPFWIVVEKHSITFIFQSSLCPLFSFLRSRTMAMWSSTPHHHHDQIQWDAVCLLSIHSLDSRLLYYYCCCCSSSVWPWRWN